MKWFVFLLLSVLLASTECMAHSYATRVLSDDIATLRVQFHPDYSSATYLSRPVLTLDGNEMLDVSFDQLSHEVHYYSYTLCHLDAAWEKDNLQSQEFVTGNLSAEITEYEQSFGTQQLYTHYHFMFPNEEMAPLISGNYVLLIYEDNDPDKIVAEACFSVAEKSAAISAVVRSNTDLEYNGRFQQLDVDVTLPPSLSYLNAQYSALVVEQNNRSDNRVVVSRPTFIDGQKLRWQNSKTLIFEGGNEYRHFDISSGYFKGQGVDRIVFEHEERDAIRTSGYHAILFDSELRADHYMFEPDADGRAVVNAERTELDDTEADYMWVHWSLPVDQWLDGGVYVLGDVTGNTMQQASRMQYNAESRRYEFCAYLKQGGYEWLYAFYNTRKGGSASLQRVEGSYWQTHNTYRLYYYYQGVNDRYVRLLAVVDVTN